MPQAHWGKLTADDQNYELEITFQAGSSHEP